MSFRGLSVVVTGGTGALGGAVTAALVARGASVWIPNYAASELAAFALSSHDDVHVRDGVDLTDEASAATFYASVPDLWASIHVAGGFAMAPLLETSAADVQHMFNMNAMTCFLSCREAVRQMRATGRGGRIVNVAARPALLPGAGMVAYTTSKAAVVSLTQAIAAEVSGDDILVNAIAPSIFDTPANRAAMPDADHGAWPSPAALAQTIAFLASPDNAVTSGAVVPVYGRS